MVVYDGGNSVRGDLGTRFQPILSRVDPAVHKKPAMCLHNGCQGRHFEHHQVMEKPLKDTVYQSVSAVRYRCLRCGRTFRVHPDAVTKAQSSQRIKGPSVMLYLLGLSYGATSLALEALGVHMCKASIYEAGQAAAEQVPGMKRDEVLAGVRTPALGGDLTSVKCNGEWLPLGLAVDDTTGLVLTGVSAYWLHAVQGLVMMTAIMLDQLRKRRR